MADLPVPIGTVIAGRYRVDRVLGAGSMGVVAAAFHLEFEHEVAIKFVLPAALGQAEAAERFRREVRAAAKIKSEHVARVLDVGALDTGLAYMVMELLEGRTLEEELAARGSLPVSEAVEYVLQAIEALAEAHAAGIVHRDLKPANLFLSRRADRSRMVKVLDFGVSKSLRESEGNALRLTRTGMIVGSPLYMSPEQLGASKAAVPSDVWALGAILFELLSGSTPYKAGSMPDLYAMLLRDAPNPISLYRADVPPGLEAVIGRCLLKDPDLRFDNVSALAEALLPFAPPHARLHAVRARGVLFPSLSKAEETAFRQSEVGSSDELAQKGPSANTVSSWSAEVWTQAGRALLGGLVATLLVLGLSFAVLKLRVEGTAQRAIHAASTMAAGSLANALTASRPAAQPAGEPLTALARGEANANPETAGKLPGPGPTESVAVPKSDERKLASAGARAVPAAPRVETPGELPHFGGRK